MSHTHHQEQTPGGTTPGPAAGHRGHGWMMIICCIPMLIIAVALVVTGVVSGSFLIFALLCTAMMALMMSGMHGGGHGRSSRRQDHDQDHDHAEHNQPSGSRTDGTQAPGEGPPVSGRF